jgi:hypothetical protein
VPIKSLSGVLFCGSLLALVQSPLAEAKTPPKTAKASAKAKAKDKDPVAEKAPEKAPACDVKQGGLMKEGDLRATPYSAQKHLAKNFPDGKVSWLMKDSTYQQFVIKTAAKNFGRCNDDGCFLFVAPRALIHDAVKKAIKDGKHDAAVIGKALGLPAANFEGPLRLMTLDLNAVASCSRLPVDADPGVWKCQTPQDTDCFKFGGYTSGGVPELMVINAPVEKTQVEVIP